MSQSEMPNTELPLSGKAIVITGGARGIGESCAMLASELGADLVIADIDGDVLDGVATTIRERGGSVEVVEADVSEFEQSRKIVETCVAKYGRIDGLVNDAALHVQEWFWDLDPEQTRRMVEVNVLGPILCAHAAAVAMRERGGTIVNVTSGSQAGLATWSAYSATKASVATLTYSLALELADAGIRVNALSPVAGTRMSVPPPGFEPNVPSGHDAFPPASNNAAVVAFLLSDFSAPLTGQVVRVDADGISLMTHPAILGATFRAGSGWSFGEVRGHFDNGLTDAAVPLGIVRQ